MILIAGLSGLSFHVWPAGFNDHKLSATPELSEHPQRSTVLRAMKAILVNFGTPESEERDQLLMYLTKVMQICGVDSSDELFNVWRYGFPYGWFF